MGFGPVIQSGEQEDEILFERAVQIDVDIVLVLFHYRGFDSRHTEVCVVRLFVPQILLVFLFLLGCLFLFFCICYVGADSSKDFLYKASFLIKTRILRTPYRLSKYGGILLILNRISD